MRRVILISMPESAEMTVFSDYRDHLSPDLALEADANREVIEEILRLKAAGDVLILGHNYMSPLVFNLADEECRGDSLALSIHAARTDKPVILFNGVYFMAETAKLLNPDKVVLIADKEAGCSLADGYRREDVLELKRQYPGIPIVTYINSYAAIKAESDICCTSANALDVIISRNSERVIFLPDSLMGRNLQEEIDRRGLGIDLIYPGKGNRLHQGTCEVHDKITVEEIRRIRIQHQLPKGHPRRVVLVHWECRPEVVEEADFCGSTSQMSRYIRDHKPERVFLGTECEMAANLEMEYPATQFIRLCNVFCRHMARIRLDRIVDALKTRDHRYQVQVEEEARLQALRPIQRMLALSA
ncbi:MAG: quinolinate synthase [Acidobacteriota bacterium]